MKLPQRIQRKRTKGWKQPKLTCYCGRGSKWGNPFIVGEKFTVCAYDLSYEFVMTLMLSLSLYEKWLDEMINLELVDLTELLKYDYLSCWCPLDQKCHVDILISKLKELNK